MAVKILTTAEISIEVKKVVEKHGWDIMSTYNDKRKAYRRLKYMRNGWRISKKMKSNILKDLNKSFKSTTVLSISFEVGYSYRGEYDYLEIKNSL